MKKSLRAKPMVFPCPVFVVGTYDSAGVRSYFACGRHLGDGFKLGKDLGK